MEILKNEKLKYLVAAIAGCFLFFVGSIIYYYGIYAVTNNVTGISFVDFMNHLTAYSDPMALSILQYVSYVPFLLVMLILFKDDLHIDWINFKINWKKYLIYVGVGVICIFVTNFIVSFIYMLLKIEGESNNEEIITKMLLSEGALPMIISVVILAPLAEELLFRKIMFGVCEKTLNLKPIITIILSTLVFSFIHVTDVESLKYIFQYIPLALIMCSIYHLSDNNIFASILIHAANNGISVILTYVLVLIESWTTTH